LVGRLVFSAIFARKFGIPVVSAEGTLGIDSFPAAPGVYLIRSVPS